MASDASDPAGSSESLLLAIARDLGFKRPPLTLPKDWRETQGRVKGSQLTVANYT